MGTPLGRRDLLKTGVTAVSVGIAGCLRGEQPDLSVYHVAPDGNDGPGGTEDDPFASIQRAIEEAEPGDEIAVAAGEYHAGFETVRPGEPDAPITIRGPETAIVRSGNRIKHSHIHLRGLTLNGLTTPSRAEDPSAYVDQLVRCRPPADSDDYLEDIVCSPAAVGNSRRPLLLFERTAGLEVGPFRVIGLAGAHYVLTDEPGHAGEIVYLGQPPSTVERDDYPWDEIDQTRHVHVHHIDNSAGHPHSELVNTKIGTRDVLVEYCTSHGGSQNTERSFAPAEVRFQSYDATLRWCDLRNGTGDGVHIVETDDWLSQRPDPPIPPDRSGTIHAIYGNRISGFEGKAIRVPHDPEQQGPVCGNDITGPSDLDPGAPCPQSVPEGDGIGHTGGTQ